MTALRSPGDTLHHVPRFRVEPGPAVTSGVEAMNRTVLELLPAR
ncbi:MAG: hypothetical protein OES32_13440 [Acidobacteriota bacterium]|nr:hypothetical protein [Acidobacteriota bacterium]MDH3524582.1 hypothetical protein [Acidobacteriota bacterium]